jgi:hypothetical protein
MYQLATLGIAYNIVAKNTVLVRAGDTITGLASVFSGTIFSAYGDFEAQPDVPFIIGAKAGLASLVAPVPASSFPGSTDVATIMSGFARQLGMGFENNGVNVQLPSPYFSGTLQDQIRKCAEHARIDTSLDTAQGNGTLAIWPKGGSRTSIVNAPIISPSTGMIGYPAITQQGIIVKTLFSPLITRGGRVQVQSELLSGTLTAVAKNNSTFQPPAMAQNGNSIWTVYKLDHALDSLVRNGQWMSTVYCYNANYPNPIPQQ